MRFKNIDEIQEYIDKNSKVVTRELPYCSFCDNVVESYYGVVEYCELETEDGFEIFCCKGHMERYLEKFINHER